MTLGGCIFAEKAVADFNEGVRRRRRALARNERAWEEERELREMDERRHREEEKREN